MVDWDKNGIPDLLVGAEDGYFYYKKNPRAELAQAQPSGSSSVGVATPTLQQVAVKDDSPVVVSEFIYETAPFAQCHATTIAETPGGLVAAWFGGTRESDPDVGIWVSRHAPASHLHVASWAGPAYWSPLRDSTASAPVALGPGAVLYGPAQGLKGPLTGGIGFRGVWTPLPASSRQG